MEWKSWYWIPILIVGVMVGLLTGLWIIILPIGLLFGLFSRKKL